MAPRRSGRADRSERTAVFGKTKLCKFHILGVCDKGAGCNFAHEASQLNNLPDLAKTRVCKVLISTGRCNDPDCLYAHSKDELREMPVVPEQTPGVDRYRSYPAPHAAQPQAVSLTPPAISGVPLAFSQPPPAQMQHPAVQVLMLQQMAAQLSMQAAMLLAGPVNNWPVQPCRQLPAQPLGQPSAQLPVQHPAPQQKEIHQSCESKGQKIQVKLHTLMAAAFHPEFSKFAVDEPVKLPEATPKTLAWQPHQKHSDFFGFADRREIGDKNFQDTPLPQRVTVKNTFLDFQPEKRSDGMRAVQTYSGGLSFMTGQEDDDDEV